MLYLLVIYQKLISVSVSAEIYVRDNNKPIDMTQLKTFHLTEKYVSNMWFMEFPQLTLGHICDSSLFQRDFF